MKNTQKPTASSPLRLIAECFPNKAWHIDKDGNYWETINGEWINQGKGLPKGKCKEVEKCNPVIDPRHIV